MSSFITSKVNGNQVGADEWNQLADYNALISSSRQTPSTSDTNQSSIAAASYASGGQFYLDIGTENSYVLNTVLPFKAPVNATLTYFVGMIIKFRAGNANTGASTVNVNSAGVKNLKKEDGITDLDVGDISTTNDITFRYNGTSFVRVLEKNPLFSNKNAIINGDFNIWQRGTSFASVVDSTYTTDRFIYRKTGSMVHDISRSTDVPTQAGRLFNYSALVDCQTADASISATKFCHLTQAVEGFNFLPLAQKSMTLSFYVKATKTGIYCVSFKNAANNRSFVAEYTINASDTWEFKTVVIAASPSAGTWDYTNGIGIAVGFTLACGSNFQTTANSWQTGDFVATANQVNACDSTSNNFRITGVQLEAGSVATPFENRTIQEELTLCQRYFEILGGSANTPLCTAFASSTTGAQGIINYVVEKRAAASISFGGTNKFRFNNATSNYVSSNVVANNSANNVKSFNLTLTISGVTANSGGVIDTVDTLGTISISSEL